MDLAASVAIVVIAAAESGDPSSIELAERWAAEIRCSGPGTIDLGLEDTGASSNERATAVALLQAGGARLELMLDPVPAPTFAVFANGRRFYDYSKELIKQALGGLEALLVHCDEGPN